MVAAAAPDRGDLAWITFNPQAGHEQAGRRPAVVLSSAAYNQRVGLALFCPITNQVKGYPFEVPVPEGAAVSGVVLADQVKSLDWRARDARVVGRLPGSAVEEVLVGHLSWMWALSGFVGARHASPAQRWEHAGQACLTPTPLHTKAMHVTTDPLGKLSVLLTQ